MTIYALDSVTDTYDCKIPNCPETARSNRGRHAYLCDRHAEEYRLREQDARAAARDAADAGEIAAEPSAPVSSISQIADRIPPAARRLEERLLRRRVARDEAQDAIRSLNAILADLREAVQELS